jgi:hypothetical protein
MREPIHLIILALAIVLFFLAAVMPGPPVEPWRLRIIAAGLFCWAIASIVVV